jgi:amino acid transporter
MAFRFQQMVFGKRLQTDDLEHQAISRPIGLAVFASDALSSTAYATQEILIILSYAVTAGAALWTTQATSINANSPIGTLAMPIAIAIAVLLTIVTISYRQTIYAYPNGGGAYIVARDNLGEIVAQVAGAALLTDYILTVAVSISAGVAQIVSAFPNLLPYRVEIALAVIIFMTIVNLRGVKESGVIFSIPTYFFLVTMILTLVYGIIRYLTGTLPTVADVEAVHHNVLEPLGLFLILRAFSSGCTALTGIEAISNGITAFKHPKSHNAAVTLMWMSGILITLFLGITFLAIQIQAVPSEVETVISQMGRTVWGDSLGFMYLFVIAGTALILLMAANTAYADFPRLAALQAGDGFLPRQLTHRGGRLVFSWGIVTLAFFAMMLIVISGASVTFLVPLYAIGVFLCFTISQAGMVVRYNKIGKLKPGEVVKGMETELHYEKNWRAHQAVSAVGAVCTFIVMWIFAITKFTTGAWFVVVLIPVLVFIFFQIHNHYKEVAKVLSLPRTKVDTHPRPIQTLILVDDVHAETARMVNFAKSLGAPWKALHIGVNPEKAAKVGAKWQERIGEGTIEVIPSPYRLLAEPIREYVLKLLAETEDGFVHIIMGQLVMDTFWEQALHQNSVLIFNLALAGLDRVVVTNVPYQIHHERDESGHFHLVGEQNI